jgi:hypothetical protein
MVRYHSYVEALQWLGTNVIEVRQFVRANSDAIAGAVISGTELTLTSPLGNIPGETVIVQLNEWIVCSQRHVSVMTPEAFAAQYELDT